MYFRDQAKALKHVGYIVQSSDLPLVMIQKFSNIFQGLFKAY